MASMFGERHADYVNGAKQPEDYSFSEAINAVNSINQEKLYAKIKEDNFL